MDIIVLVKIIFWISIAVLLYTYFGYPSMLWFVSKFFAKRVNKGKFIPKISFVVVAHNEEDCIEKKIRNIISLDYPRNNLEIIFGLDGSTDRTNEILENYKKSGIKIVVSKKRIGKVNVLKTILNQIKNEFVVFSDARQIFEVKALKELISNFYDPKVGCVSGELILKKKDKSFIKLILNTIGTKKNILIVIFITIYIYIIF